MNWRKFFRFRHEYRNADILVSESGYRVFYPVSVEGKLDYRLVEDEFLTLKEAKAFVDTLSLSDSYPSTEAIRRLISG